MADDFIKALCDRVKDHAARKAALRIRGGGTKDFYGARLEGEPLEVAAYAGIVAYEPRELVLTVKAGTRLAEIESALAAEGQMLAFEPPRFGEAATIGGTVACNLSGPRRPYAGAARDFVLGARIVNGKGEDLSFGGRVIKNVAGYDVSRLMTGAFGTLGLLLDVSLKVLPRPAASRTLVQERNAAEAVALMNRWAGRPLPISATCYDGERLYVRLSGADKGVVQAAVEIGGEPLPRANGFWQEKIREQGHGFFAGDAPLWRLSLPQSAPPVDLPGKQLIEWGGAQRWLRSDAPAAIIREAAAKVGGHASLFRGGDRAGEVFHPLHAALMALHRNLKQAFDPAGLLNPGRLYAGL